MVRKNGLSRRRFVSNAAAGLFAGAVTASAAAADPSGDAAYPVVAEGKRFYHFEPLDDDTFERRERFVSPDLRAAFGKAELEVTTDVVERESVPERFRDPDTAGTVSYQDAGVFGTWEQHYNAEKELRGEDLTASYDYNGPLYNYKSSDITERSAPINVGWRYYHGFDAGDVDSIMHNNGWDGSLISTDRYVLVFTGSTSYDIRKQAAHTKKPTGWTTQWHGRLWNLPDYDDDGYDVIGSYHHDPWDHGWVSDADWRFSESRRECSDDWESWGYYATTQNVGNGGSYGSSNGNFDAI